MHRMGHRGVVAAALCLALFASTFVQAQPSCRLHSVYRGMVFNLGTLDPANAGDANVSRGGMRLQGACAQASEVMILEPQPLALAGPQGARLPYTVRAQVEPGADNTSYLSVSVSIPKDSYADLPAGDYAGHFTISVMP